jgi:hypothetical protein
MKRSGKTDEKARGKDVKLLKITFRTLFEHLGHLID